MDFDIFDLYAPQCYGVSIFVYYLSFAGYMRKQKPGWGILYMVYIYVLFFQNHRSRSVLGVCVLDQGSGVEACCSCCFSQCANMSLCNIVRDPIYACPFSIPRAGACGDFFGLSLLGDIQLWRHGRPSRFASGLS
jgi:hypothetical protein